MSFSLQNSVIKGKTLNPPRILVYSPIAVGKSTFASHFKSPLFLDLEGSLENIDTEKTPVLKTAAEAMQVLESLYTEEHSYKTVVIDTLDWLEQRICEEIASKYDSKGERSETGVSSIDEIAYHRGYSFLVDRWAEFIAIIEELRTKKGMTIVLLAHAEIKSFCPPSGESYDMYFPKLYGKKDKNKTSLALFVEYCDIVAFANFKTYTKESGSGFNKKNIAVSGNERVMYLDASNPGFISKNRYNLEPILPFDFQAFQNDFINKTKKEEK